MRTRFVTVALALAFAWTAQAVAQTELKVASFVFPRADLNTKVIGPFVDAVNAELKGAATLKLYAGGALGRNPVQQYKLVDNKVAEIAYIVQGYTPGAFPDVTIFDLPFLVENSLEGSVGHWRLNARGLMRGYDKVKVIALFTLPGYSLHATRPISGIDDLKGLKVRSTGAYQGNSLTALGATPVGGITVTQVLEALNRDVIQGTVADFGGMVAFRYDSVTKNHFDIPMGTAAAGVVMNLEVYNALPRAVRDAIDKHSGEAMSRTHGEVFDGQYRRAVAKLRADPTHRFVAPSPSDREAVRRRLQPVTDGWMGKDPNNKKRYEALVAIIEDIRNGR